MFNRLIVLALIVAIAVLGQSTTGTITGTIQDASGGAVPGASVKATLVTTGSVRDALTSDRGDFTFTALTPGVYRITVEKEGFRAYAREDVNLTPNDRLALGEIVLTVGSTSESITVRAEGATVQTASSERSGLISANQVQNLTVINRDFSALIGLLPGVAAQPRGESVGFGGNSLFNVQGGRTSGNNITVDGQPAADLGNAFGVTAFVSMDTVSEVKIQVSGFAAEFGRKPGANIQAITKSGTQSLRGLAYWYKRHEMFNANSFFNNRNRVPEARYRYTTAGYNVGGPVTIGRFNRNKDKLFFFFSQEHLREMRPQPIRQVTVPTLAERAGNFADSRDTNGALIRVNDPQNGGAQFPGNIVPASRINPNGRAYLNLLPEPNFLDIGLSARRYNYQAQESLEAPKRTELIRVDYNIGNRTTMYGRFNNWWEDIRGWAVPGGNANWGWLPSTYLNTAKSGLIALTRVLSPSTVLEFSTGVNRATENATPYGDNAIPARQRQNAGFRTAQFYPQNNPLSLVPQASFGGISQPANPTYENRFPLRGTDTLYTLNAMATRIQGRHSVKVGLWGELARNNEGEDGNFAGSFNFGRDVNNPLDSNHPYANALLGNFSSYTESTTRPSEMAQSYLWEFFGQDNWKVNSRLTLDFGARFSWAQPYWSTRGQEAGFVPALFNASRAVQLIRPARIANRRVGVHPVTGEVYPAAAIGALAPGVGDPLNGSIWRATSPDVPKGLRANPGIVWAPRFGFAYDPFGKGRTAIRGAAGLFLEARDAGNRGFGIWRNPPLRADPIIYYGNLDTLLSSSGVNFTSDTSNFTGPWPMQRVLNLNLTVQHNLGWGTVADVAYVGSLGRNLLQARNYNSIPFGANFAKANEDPTNPGRPLPPAFLRPYIGYNNITLYDYGQSSSYHSLQVSFNRRFTRGLQFGGNWTWSKAMGYGDSNTAAVSYLIDPKVWNYGKLNYDRTHIANVNFVWDVPRMSKGLFANPFGRQLLDGWQISGIWTAQSGTPLGMGLGFVDAIDITGSPTDGARVVVTGNPVLPKSERTFSRNFNTDVIRPPAVGTVGNAPRDVIRGPGFANWDLSLFKNFAMPGERFKLQFRGEFYNAFNNTNFSALDTGARFDRNGVQANPRLGEFTDARQSRRVQLALRLSF